MTTAESLLSTLIEACEAEDQSNSTEEACVNYRHKLEALDAARAWLTQQGVAGSGIGRPMRNGSTE